MKKVEQFLVKSMGKEAYESLLKYDLYKIKTNTVVSDQELFNALQIVPAAVLSFLKKELVPMKDGESKKIGLPIDKAVLDITKHAKDVYSGSIYENGKNLAQFKFRPLPSVGLVILSTFELYDVKDFGSAPKELEEDKIRIADKIDKAVNKNGIRKVDDEPSVKTLKDFVKKKMEKREFEVVNLTKSDSVKCPDCDHEIVGAGAFTGCVCLGNDRTKKVYLAKSEGKTVIRFSKGWDKENIELVLEALRKRG